MSRYVTIRLTLAQAKAASNACDLIRDQLDSAGEAKLYERASEAIDEQIAGKRCGVRLSMGEAYGIQCCAKPAGHANGHATSAAVSRAKAGG